MNDEDLYDRLSAVNVPPSRVTPDSVLLAGRQRVARRRWVAAGGSVALLTAVLLGVPALAGHGEQRRPAVTVTPSSTCRTSTLPLPPGTSKLVATAVDPTGHYIVGSPAPVDGKGMVLWKDGKPTVLSTVPPGASAADVNASGIIAGTFWKAGTLHVFRYSDGSYTEMPLPHPTLGVLRPVVNAGGDILVTNISQKYPGVFLWKAGRTGPIQLPLPTLARSTSLADDGTIYGFVPGKDGFSESAYAWDQQGHGRKLDVPSGYDAVVNGVGGDWATGSLGTKYGSGAVALWNVKSGAVTTLTKADSGSRVNASGWIVTFDGQVLRNGAQVPLPATTSLSPTAYDISDTGLVVGEQTRHSNGQVTHEGPRIWQC